MTPHVEQTLSLLRDGKLSQQQAASLLNIPLVQLLKLASAAGISVIAYAEESFEQELYEIRKEPKP